MERIENSGTCKMQIITSNRQLSPDFSGPALMNVQFGDDKKDIQVIVENGAITNFNTYTHNRIDAFFNQYKEKFFFNLSSKQRILQGLFVNHDGNSLIGKYVTDITPKMAFGEEKWNEYFGDVGQVPSLPNNIEDILNSQCPYTGKKVRESHLLTLIPATVNGQALTLSKLGKLIRSPKKGYSTEYSNCNVGENDKAVNSSYWTLLLKDVIPNSRKKTFDEQKQLLKQNYNVPKAIETAVSVLMHHVQGGEKLYSDSPDTYTRSEEKYNGYRLLVGGFGSGGLNVYNRFNLIVDYGNEYSGLSALRKF
jgi:hypothetical protein